MGTIIFEYETTNLDESTNKTLKVEVEFSGTEDENAFVEEILMFDVETKEEVSMQDLNLYDQKCIEDKAQWKADDGSWEDWIENQMAKAESYYEGDR